MILLSGILTFVALVALAGPVLAQSTVLDQTGSLPQITITQIDDRNSSLETKTGTSIAVFLELGTQDETEQDALTKVQNALGQRFSALVWIQSRLNKGEIIYFDPAVKWVTPDQQDALNTQLQNAVQNCCLSDNLPHVVDAIATDMEAGATIPPDPHHYVLDDIGLLDAAHLAAIAAREQQLESSTGKGVGVILIDEPADQSSGDVALRDARSLNVKGDVAAVVWVARSGSSLTFSAVPMPAYANIISQASFGSINANFNSDMQSGQINDAVEAAVDRTAAVVAGASTPMPAATATAAGPAAALSQATAPSGNAGLPSQRTLTSRQIWLLVLLAVAISAIIAIVAFATRRNQLI